MEIKKILNYGGTQQFADIIINKYPDIEFDDNDLKLLAFIDKNADNDKKAELVESIAKVNDDETPSDEKEKQKGKISRFLAEHKKDIVKWSGVIGKAALGIILAKFGLTLVDVGLD